MQRNINSFTKGNLSILNESRMWNLYSHEYYLDCPSSSGTGRKYAVTSWSCSVEGEQSSQIIILRVLLIPRNFVSYLPNLGAVHGVHYSVYVVRELAADGWILGLRVRETRRTTTVRCITSPGCVKKIFDGKLLCAKCTIENRNYGGSHDGR